MRISQKHSNQDLGAESFLSKMFTGFSADNNLENDRDKIRAIEKALNGLVVNGVTLKVESEGVADNQLAAMLRTPEVLEALNKAAASGVVHDVEFKKDFNFAPESVRMHNIEERGKDSGAVR